MPIDFKPLSMMELRGSPGEILDRVANRGEAFVVERNGQQKACLVPLSLFMPDIQPVRLSRELERLHRQDEQHTTAISDDHQLELRFHHQGHERNVTITIRLPHGYPNVCPKVYAEPLPPGCPHRWQDGSLCIFGAVEAWNPGKHTVVHVLRLARQWLVHHTKWKRTGEWPSEEVVDGE